MMKSIAAKSAINVGLLFADHHRDASGRAGNPSACGRSPRTAATLRGFPRSPWAIVWIRCAGRR
jgi:hypothetical protein